VASWDTVIQTGTAAHWAKITDLAVHPYFCHPSLLIKKGKRLLQEVILPIPALLKNKILFKSSFTTG
jgi:hypothetical protein